MVIEGVGYFRMNIFKVSERSEVLAIERYIKHENIEVDSGD